MNANLTRLAEQRERLIAHAAAQRTALGHAIEPLRTPLSIADQGLAALRFIKRHPAWIVGGAVLIAAVRPGPAGKWLGRGWLAWRIVQQLRGK
jgi:hypothetical protein